MVNSHDLVLVFVRFSLCSCWLSRVRVVVLGGWVGGWGACVNVAQRLKAFVLGGSMLLVSTSLLSSPLFRSWQATADQSQSWPRAWTQEPTIHNPAPPRLNFLGFCGVFRLASLVIASPFGLSCDCLCNWCWLLLLLWRRHERKVIERTRFREDLF